MSTNIGHFTWYDLNTPDVAGGHDFYTQVIGWTLTPFNPGYQMFTAASPIGGAMELSADAKAMGAPPHWLGYVCVADAEASAAKTVALGGTLHAPTFEMPDVGHIAIVADPQGAVFGLFQPSGGAGEFDPTERDGEIVWRELMSTDVDGAGEFYSALLGWRLADTMDMGPMGQYSMYGPPESEGASVGVMKTMPEMPTSAWIYYIHVGDLDATLARTKAHGGSVMNGPMEIPGGMRVAQCVDPQGGVFAVHGK